MRPFRVLSFDGGGVRGVMSARLMQRLDDAEPGLARTAAMYAGSSTGAIVAAGLAYGVSPRELVALYTEHAEYIFTPKGTSRLRPRYGNAHLLQVLYSVFPERLRLCDLKRAVVIPTFRIRSPGDRCWRPVVLTNLAGSQSACMLVVDAIMASSAAPGFFPSYGPYIDGGIVDSNPSITAIAYAARVSQGVRLSQLRVLSIGTGFMPQKIVEDTSEWGELQWFLYPRPRFPLPTALMSSQSQTSTLYSGHLLGDNYMRVNPVLQPSVPLDSYESIPRLLSVADSYPLQGAQAWIGTAWQGVPMQGEELG